METLIILYVSPTDVGPLRFGIQEMSTQTFRIVNHVMRRYLQLREKDKKVMIFITGANRDYKPKVSYFKQKICELLGKPVVKKSVGSSEQELIKEYLRLQYWVKKDDLIIDGLETKNTLDQASSVQEYLETEIADEFNVELEVFAWEYNSFTLLSHGQRVMFTFKKMLRRQIKSGLKITYHPVFERFGNERTNSQDHLRSPIKWAIFNTLAWAVTIWKLR
ncbi:MAG: hypothetical protein AAGF07_00995 [Patescibacteria group bacterium]